MFKQSNFYLLLLLIVSGCASQPAMHSNHAGLDNLEICRQYISTYPGLENGSKGSFTDSETSSIVDMIDEVRMRGLNEELCKQILFENS